MFFCIENKGEIESSALSLVGASTKRNDESKIGEFGTGNKYALAYLMKNGYNPKIYSGNNEIKLGIVQEKLRGITYNVITFNGTTSSITTEMGKDWKLWQAIREVICNAIDEDGCLYYKTNLIEPEENTTKYYIEINSELEQLLNDFSNYFSFSIAPLFECEYGQILPKTEGPIKIYRNGILCVETEAKGAFNYNIYKNIDVGEDRLAKYTFQVKQAIWDIIKKANYMHYISNIISLCGYELSGFTYTTIYPTDCHESFNNYFKTHKIAPVEMAGYLKPDEQASFTLVPLDFYNKLSDFIPEENKPKKLRQSNFGVSFVIIEPNDLQTKVIEQALDFLKRKDFNIPYLIELVEFNDKDIYGSVQGETILISTNAVTMGVDIVLQTIIEEFIHIKYDCPDESRSFQDSIIAEFICYLRYH